MGNLVCGLKGREVVRGEVVGHQVAQRPHRVAVVKGLNEAFVEAVAVGWNAHVRSSVLACLANLSPLGRRLHTYVVVLVLLLLMMLWK